MTDTLVVVGVGLFAVIVTACFTCRYVSKKEDELSDFENDDWGTL
nr:MAG TPA: Interleukin-13, Interleukin-13 receptor subunit alpha-2, receptor, decoy, decoy receptor [Caudoviricetes sp.]